MPLEETGGVQLGDPIIARRSTRRSPWGRSCWAACSTDSGIRSMAAPPIEAASFYDLYRPPGNPLDREHITEPLVTGIRAIDSMLPCGKGQRIGIFGGSGVGKSTLLGSMSRHNFADVTVIALIGERNREVRAFLEHDLGPEGMKRAVVVVATSDQPAPLRVRACFVALAIAEYFRDQGKDVLLVMDSVTRLAMAQREIGLAAGEPPSQKGYTPSVFGLLPEDLRARRQFSEGLDHRLLYGAGGRRRFQRADLRRGTFHSRRPYRSLAASGRGRPLSGDRCARIGEPPQHAGFDA